jgi:DNA-binding beta-propeller fold protein YncE
MYVIGTNTNKVSEYSLSTAWNVTTASHVRDETVGSTPTGLFFSDDGTRLYVSDLLNDTIFQYSLSTAWDISTLTLVRSRGVGVEEGAPQDLFFKPDGTRMYVIGDSGVEVNEYSLSTAWDISTETHVRAYSVSTYALEPRGLFFKPDGTKMYVVDLDDDIVIEYSLSTAWNISTASYVRQEGVLGQDDFMQGMYIRPDGKRMYLAGANTDFIYEYTLT